GAGRPPPWQGARAHERSIAGPRSSRRSRAAHLIPERGERGRRKRGPRATGRSFDPRRSVGERSQRAVRAPLPAIHRSPLATPLPEFAKEFAPRPLAETRHPTRAPFLRDKAEPAPNENGRGIRPESAVPAVRATAGRAF